MSVSKYKIVITGLLDSNMPLDDIVEKFAKRFKLTNEKAKGLIEQIPVVINKEADEKTARVYYDALAKAGLACVIKNQAGEVVELMGSITNLYYIPTTIVSFRTNSN